MARRSRGRAAAAGALVLVALGVAAPSADAHAQLESTSPDRGVVVAREPAQVAFRFDEPVEKTLGAVQVFDAEARRVDTGPVLRPGGQSSGVAIALKDGLPRGTYTATYRVISADGHTVSGGMTFSIGAAGTRPPASVDKLLDGAKAGPLVSVARDAGQGIGYLALALLAGCLAWGWLCLRPALADAELTPAGGPAALALLQRGRRIGLIASAAGLVASVLVLAAEGAGAGGTGLVAALHPDVLREIAGTRTGTVTTLEALAFAGLLVLLALARPRAAAPVAATATRATPTRAPRRAPATAGPATAARATPARMTRSSPAAAGLRAMALAPDAAQTPRAHAGPAAAPLLARLSSPKRAAVLGAIGLGASDRRVWPSGSDGPRIPLGTGIVLPGGRALLAALSVLAVALVVLPAFEGHQATQPQPFGPLLDVGHVAAMSVWLGGIAALLLILPAGTRALEPLQRTQLLTGVLRRFSPLALAAVLTLATTGTLAAIFELGAVRELWQTGYGRTLLVKIVLLAVLVGAGAIHRRRALPALESAAAAQQTPGATGRLIRSVLRAEALLLVGVLGATALLVASSPPGAAGASGPVTLRQDLGPLQLETTVDPARPGANAVHLYLFDAKSGAPYAGTKEITATVALPGRIEPLPVTLRRAGPGHYVADTLQLAPAGTWRLRVVDRVSDFDQYQTDVQVKVR